VGGAAAVSRAQVSFLCSCGGGAHASSTPRDVAIELVGRIRDKHIADGHREVGQPEYDRIRARQRREETERLRRR